MINERKKKESNGKKLESYMTSGKCDTCTTIEIQSPIEPREKKNSTRKNALLSLTIFFSSAA